MGASQISVTLFHGTQKTTFPVGATPGKNLRWKVFTIDARTAKMYPNVDNEELHQAPYVEKKENYHGEVTQDWNNCLDHAMWCTLAHGELITGFKRSGPVNLNNFQEASVGLIKESPKVECTATEVGFGGPEEKWGVCKTGSVHVGPAPQRGWLRSFHAIGGAAVGADHVLRYRRCRRGLRRVHRR